MRVWTMESDIRDLIEDFRAKVLPVAAARTQREDALASSRPAASSWAAAVQPTAGEELAARDDVRAVLAGFGIAPDRATRDPKFIAMAQAQADRADRRRVATSVTEFVARPEVISGLKAAGMSDQQIRAAVEGGDLENWLRRRGAL